MVPVRTGIKSMLQAERRSVVSFDVRLFRRFRTRNAGLRLLLSDDGLVAIAPPRSWVPLVANGNREREEVCGVQFSPGSWKDSGTDHPPAEQRPGYGSERGSWTMVSLEADLTSSCLIGD